MARAGRHTLAVTAPRRTDLRPSVEAGRRRPPAATRSDPRRRLRHRRARPRDRAGRPRRHGHRRRRGRDRRGPAFGGRLRARAVDIPPVRRWLVGRRHGQLRCGHDDPHAPPCARPRGRARPDAAVAAPRWAAGVHRLPARSLRSPRRALAGRVARAPGGRGAAPQRRPPAARPRRGDGSHRVGVGAGTRRGARAQRIGRHRATSAPSVPGRRRVVAPVSVLGPRGRPRHGKPAHRRDDRSADRRLGGLVPGGGRPARRALPLRGSRAAHSAR